MRTCQSGLAAGRPPRLFGGLPVDWRAVGLDAAQCGPGGESPGGQLLAGQLHRLRGGFSGVSDYTVAYQFTPSAAGADYTYQITFTDPEGNAATFDAPCSGGTGSRSAAAAKDLDFSAGSAGRTPQTG